MMPTLPEKLLDLIPDGLHAQVQLYWQQWLEACEQQQIDHQTLRHPELLVRAWACSEFVARSSIRYPQQTLDLFEQGFGDAVTLDQLNSELNRLLLDVVDDATLRKTLRQFRNQHMMRIALRDLLQQAEIATLLQEQSDLATAIVQQLSVYLHKRYEAGPGVARDETGERQSLVVLGMGKLGGGELNFSSDIDLIFFYPQDGKADGRGNLSNHEYFQRLCRDFVTALDDVTEDGFVFRVDTRLRPYGKSGPLAMSFNAMENYYQSQGREWERYAMIKARVLVADDAAKEALVGILKPFVYRRYLDFTVIEGIRDMKAMIEQQLKRRSLQGNIKLGKGGIREIEFIGQTFQLIRGGRDSRLQSRSIVTVLQTLAEAEILQARDVERLLTAYRYLRTLENRLQIERDQQVHSLPTDELAQQRLVFAMRVDSWDALLQQLQLHTDAVQEIFNRLIADDEEASSGSSSLKLVLQQLLDDESADLEMEDLKQVLDEMSIEITSSEIDVLNVFSHSQAVRLAPVSTHEVCVDLLALWLTEIEDHRASETLQRLVDIMLAVIRRPAYLSMLRQYPLLRQRLIWLCQVGPWFTEQICNMPMLLDEILDQDVRPPLPDRAELAAQLEAKISAVPNHDFELVLDSLRLFKRANLFKFAMLDVVAEHKVTDIADRLSDVAELLVQKSLAIAWADTVEKFGEPHCLVDGVEQKPGLAVIAYGKLGGAELGYGSDLDVVFIHNSCGDKQLTRGDKQLDNRSFFSKVVQRFMHILGTRTFGGVLYEIDTRLRPDGHSGLMVTSVEAFEQYQHGRAWTWEHQALVRARYVAGDIQVGQEFDRIRRSVLISKNDWHALGQDVSDMREKMRNHLASRDTSKVDFKQGRGGLVDIEFIAQAGVLLLAEQREELLDSTATLVLLSQLAGIAWLSSTEFENMYAAYIALRRAANYRSLCVENEELASTCQQQMQVVSEIWQRLFAEFEQSGSKPGSD